MVMNTLPTFSSKTEECHYWKEKAENYLHNYTELKTEYDDYVANGKAVETELESLLEQETKRANVLQHTCDKLSRENEALKEKLEELLTESKNQICELQDELCIVREERDELRSQTRDLEICKDDLENFKRAALQSIEDFEQKLNLAIERNAFLESELDEKETLRVSVQRLKDEASDLRQELDVREMKLPEGRHQPPGTQPAPHPLQSSRRAGTAPTTPTHTTTPTTNQRRDIRGIHLNQFLLNGSATTPSNLPPSSRVAALNIVGDLLRKVGALENKLASVPGFNREQPTVATTSTSPIVDKDITFTSSTSSSPGVTNARVAITSSTPMMTGGKTTAMIKPPHYMKNSSTRARPNFFPTGITADSQTRGTQLTTTTKTVANKLL